MTELSLAGLTVGYGRRPVVHDLHLGPLRPGELTALVGPNAAGKSTLLRALAGLIPATGSISLGGFEIVDADIRRTAQHVALMPQHIPQRASLSVFEAVLVALKASPLATGFIGAAEAQTRSMAVLDRLDLTHLASDPLNRLSGGQRQLASLAQALVRAPTLLLLDEPTSALDLRHQWRVMALARDLAQEGRIVIAVLHDLSLAARWADRIAVLDQGTLAAFGDPTQALSDRILAKVWNVDARLMVAPSGRPYLDVEKILP